MIICTQAQYALICTQVQLSHNKIEAGIGIGMVQRVLNIIYCTTINVKKERSHHCLYFHCFLVAFLLAAGFDQRTLCTIVGLSSSSSIFGLPESVGLDSSILARGGDKVEQIEEMVDASEGFEEKKGDEGGEVAVKGAAAGDFLTV